MMKHFKTSLSHKKISNVEVSNVEVFNFEVLIFGVCIPTHPSQNPSLIKRFSGKISQAGGLCFDQNIIEGRWGRQSEPAPEYPHIDRLGV